MNVNVNATSRTIQFFIQTDLLVSKMKRSSETVFVDASNCVERKMMSFSIIRRFISIYDLRFTPLEKCFYDKKFLWLNLNDTLIDF